MFSTKYITSADNLNHSPAGRDSPYQNPSKITNLYHNLWPREEILTFYIMKSIYLVFCLTNEDKQAIEHAFQNIKNWNKRDYWTKNFRERKFHIRKVSYKGYPGHGNKKIRQVKIWIWKTFREKSRWIGETQTNPS